MTARGHVSGTRVATGNGAVIVTDTVNLISGLFRLWDSWPTTAQQ
jgi:hypothetical protein